MNRTDEFIQYTKSFKSAEKFDGKKLEENKRNTENGDKPFYDELTDKLDDLSHVNPTSYTGILRLERDFNSLWSNTTNLFKKIQLESNGDEMAHFEGIKSILQVKLSNLSENIQEKKKRFINKNIVLEPEKPTIYLKTKRNDIMEKKNKEILETESAFDQVLKLTQKNLLEIKHIQNQISGHLVTQNENIEEIYKKNKSTFSNIKGSNKLLGKSKEKRRFMRRLTYIWLLCLSFLLIFLHFN